MPPDPPSTPLQLQKRRRLSASSTLRKPFRSPLINRPPSSSSSPNTTTPAPPPRFSPTTPASTYHLPTPSTNKRSANALVETPTKPPPPTPHRTPLRPRRPLFSPIPSDPELATAQKKHTALLSEVRALKQSMETVTQALALEANPKGDEDLVASIQKWRHAARTAADTLFGIAGDKVNRLGGPGGDAWRTIMGGGRGRGFKSYGWDEDEPKRRGTYEDDGDEGLGGEEESEKESELKVEEEWGMALMLKTLGIPEKMLGWDREGDCWKSLDEMEV